MILEEWVCRWNGLVEWFGGLEWFGNWNGLEIGI